MTTNSAMCDAADNSDGYAAGAYNGEGVVHGHIHNYDNMTYIHGHVHHGPQDPSSESAAEEQRVQTTTGNESWGAAASVMANDDFCRRYSDCQHFEFVNYHTKNAGDVSGDNSGLVANAGSADNSSSSTGPKGFRSNQYGESESAIVETAGGANSDERTSGSDSMLLPMQNKRSFSDVINNETGDVGLDCRCNPKVLEVCCDMDHVPSSVPAEEGLINSVPPAPNNDLVVCTDVKNDFFVPPAASEYYFNNELPDIDCDLTCVCPSEELHKRPDNIEDEEEEMKEAEDDIFEKFCQECITLNQEGTQKNSSHHHHYHQHPHDPHHRIHSHTYNGSNALATPSSTPSSSGESLQQEFSMANGEKTRPESSRTTGCHDHVVNSQMDLNILDELCGISSLYELPFASHMNHHNHSHEHQRGHDNQGVNLLKSSISGRVNGGDCTDNASELHNHHHHHRIQFHQHPHKQCKPAELNSNGPLIWDRQQQQTPVKRKAEEQTSVLHHHSPNSLNYGNFDMEANTINFNWSFKNEESGQLKCEWDRCFEEFPSLIDLQKHMFRDHVSQENAASNHLCNWNDCQFKGEDICSLVNHINSDHGINFGMKVLDPASLLEQREQHHSLHCSDQQCEVGKLQCCWGECCQLFSTAEELSNHLERFHLPRGQSEYQCYWRGCSRKFTQRQKMVRHLKVHSGYKPYKCTVCLKFFSSEDTLNQHMRTHSGEKPFQCHLCGKRFSVSSSLKIHIRTHTGEKPLQCKVCGKRFNESSNLNKHLKTHRKKFKCSFCAKHFDTPAKAQSHELICLCSRKGR
ncbi:ZAP1 (YJL056C) [Zygosaccharomyces parabailii]|nr:ZAP1 (YJL056C) [Zygosaccharomyces parabailii]CDH10198.1 related to Zinc-responsive transcriptional regulator ZAP1 [Zygosaccharomyces bailii ISA1307]